jgi:hypothetical protein
MFVCRLAHTLSFRLQSNYPIPAEANNKRNERLNHRRGSAAGFRLGGGLKQLEHREQVRAEKLV